MRQFAGRKTAPPLTASPLTGAAGAQQLSANGLHGRDRTAVPLRAGARREPPSLSQASGLDDRMEREADRFARASAPGRDFDLSRIRIHADPAADTACRALDARAFTLGRDVFFAAGEYDPVRPAARELLAHEFAHVLQQEAAGEARIQRQPKDPPKDAPPRQLTEAEYKAWQRAHPKASNERVGPWLPAPIYKQYTKQWFTSRGYFYSGRMVMDTSSGGYDEVWLNNAGDGREYRVYREPARPKAAETKKPEVDVDEEPADPDVLEAENYSKDRAAEKKNLIRLVEELHRKIGTPEYNGLYNRYRTLEDEWLKQLDENKERVHDLWKASDDNDSRDELSDVEEELGRLKDSWPYGAEWGSRADLPKAPGDNLTIKKPVTVTPTGPITF